MSGIFISYRRTDSAVSADRLFDRLRQHLGAELIFMDLAIAAGADFVDSINQAVGASDVLLALIGPGWLDAADGQCRIDDPNDPVRLEIAAALKHGVRVVPVLVGNATMPAAASLPDDIRELAYRHAIQLSDARWNYDVDNLVRDLDRRSMASRSDQAASAPMPAPAPARGGVGRVIGGVIGAVGGALGGVLDAMRKPRPREAAKPRQAPPSPAPPPAVDWPNTGAPVPVGAEPDAPPPEQPEAVLLAASAPPAVKPGEEFTARLAAYLGAQAADVEIELGRLSPRATSHMGMKTCQWQRGTRVTVQFAARGLEVTPAEQPFVWEGERVLLEFDVTVPQSAADSTVVLKFDVLIDGFRIVALRLDLRVTALEADIHAASSPVAAVAASARTAFASYSSKDRQRVLDRVAAVRISAGLDIFLDCLSLNPGEAWKPRLDGEIRNRDLFLLFWSSEAAQSEWVEWEWRTALGLKGKQGMQIHPLQTGVKPPDELKDLHFGDVFMLVREASRPVATPPVQ